MSYFRPSSRDLHGNLPYYTTEQHSNKAATCWCQKKCVWNDGSCSITGCLESPVCATRQLQHIWPRVCVLKGLYFKRLVNRPLWQPAWTLLESLRNPNESRFPHTDPAVFHFSISFQSVRPSSEQRIEYPVEVNTESFPPARVAVLAADPENVSCRGLCWNREAFPLLDYRMYVVTRTRSVP